ncbi:MAG: hypothetical protein RLZZ175_1131 [Bacteroidota bacterium]|jgi:hypothetical protein
MLKYFIKISILINAIFLFSCTDSNENVKPSEDDQLYMPLQVGNFIIYDVNEYVFNINGKIDTLNYQLKEKIEDTVYAGVNLPINYKLIRYKRTDITKPFVYDSTWYAYKSASNFVKTENNEKFTKLSFPIANTIKWNGNVLNNRGEDKYEYRNKGNRFFVQDTVFSPTVTVVQHDSLPIDLTARDYRTEVYGKNVGLIYKEYQIYTYDQTTGQIGKFKISTGRRLIQKISSYGKE